MCGKVFSMLQGDHGEASQPQEGGHPVPRRGDEHSTPAGALYGGGPSSSARHAATLCLYKMQNAVRFPKVHLGTCEILPPQ